VVEMPSKEVTRVDWKSQSDSRLRDAAIQRGPDQDAAWSRLVCKYRPRIAQAVRRTLIRLGMQAPDEAVEDLVEATWLRTAKEDYRVLRAWNSGKGKSLGGFLAQMGVWEVRTSRRLWANRKEVKLEEADLRRLADKPDSRLSPEEVAELKEAEVEVQAWEARLGLLERIVWEMRREGAGSRAIGLFLGRDHKTVCTILARIQKGLRQILKESEL
jgi:DNA-directed RNA polymerase specialized sigma24 family protein